MSLRLKVAAPLGALFLVAACTGGQQLSLDRDLSGLMTARGDAMAKRDFEARFAAERGLAELSKSALAAAQERASARRTEDAIAAYRVAATASWKGGEGAVDAIADRGTALCQSLGPRQPARDCAYLRAMPLLAAFDARLAHVQGVSDRLNAGKLDGLPNPAKESEATETANRIRGMTDDALGLGRVRGALETEPPFDRTLPAEFLAYFDIQRQLMLCGVESANLTLRAIRPPGPPKADALAGNEIAALRKDVDPKMTLNCTALTSRGRPIESGDDLARRIEAMKRR